jgi:hypothetical protein
MKVFSNIIKKKREERMKNIDISINNINYIFKKLIHFIN